ncbi:hypothetical protein JFL43_17145 [Viridibacillus sp. YIM B01967]|uniref:NodB homology domain-containing protein n=1 Tax=Viridibacillus soli TaxID=2798301 RepID=A0ABS1HAS8_9BACL|nr:hypothetical protein [Viridibacillus soli]MBK3496550.1 hypothetical protein [Viridibacillus soli]
MMRKIIILSIFILCALLLFIPTKEKLLEVFNVTDGPNIIAKGTHGQTLTIDVSFGDQELEQWLESLSAPYPLLLLDTDWINRSPTIIQLIQEKKIATGLLGKNSTYYESNLQALEEDIAVYEKHFGVKPLWFRTKDQLFPSDMRQVLWQEQINMLGSSKVWTNDKLPMLVKGDIITALMHKEERMSFKKIDELRAKYTFSSIEETIFGYDVKEKKFP